MSTIVATASQQNVTKLSGAASEEDRILAVTEIVLKLLPISSSEILFAAVVSALMLVSLSS
jgi:hypothetical protein